MKITGWLTSLVCTLTVIYSGGLLLPFHSNSKPLYNVNPEFNPILNEFKEAAAYYRVKISDNRMKNLVIEFGPIEEKADNPNNKIIGICNVEVVGLQLVYRITIDPHYWNISDLPYRQATLFHELGHCLLGRDHDTTMLNNYMPKSMMYPIILHGQLFQNNKEYYIKELFK